MDKYIEDDVSLPVDDRKSNLTDWKKEPTVADLKKDFQMAQEPHSRHMRKVRDWIDCYNATGDYAAPTIKGRSGVAPKLVRKLVEWRIPALTEPFLATPDLFELEPVTYEDVAAAEQNQLVLNYQFRTKIGLQRFIETCVRRATTEGTAVLRTGWEYRETETVEDIPILDYVYNEQLAEMYQQLIEQVTENPAMYDELPVEVQNGLDKFAETGIPMEVTLLGYKEEKVSKVIANHPTVDVCDIGSVYVDPTCNGDITKAKFIIHSFETCMSELEEDGSYSNLEKINAQLATQPLAPIVNTDKQMEAGFDFDDKARKNIIAYEYWGYWDYNDDGIIRPMVATWVGDTLIRLEENPFPDKRLPFVFIPLMPIKDSVYGEPDAELLKDNQKILGATTRGMVDLFGRSANGQTGFAKGLLDNTNFTRYKNGEDYMFNPQNGDVARGIYTHKFPEIPQSVLYMQQYWNNDAEALTGVKAFSQGVNGATLGDTAAAVRSANDAASKRELSILRRISDGLTAVARKFITMNAMFLTEADFVRVTNTKFVPVRPDDLAGEFDLKISISTAEEDAAKIQQLTFLLQTGQQTMPFEFVQMTYAKIAKLSKMPDLAHFIENYQPEPDPVQQKMQELELAKLGADIAEAEARAAEARAKERVYNAEVGVREARAADIQSKTDKSNLDFFKDANGVKQNEELERIAAQGAANERIQDKKLEAEKTRQREGHNQGLLRLHAESQLNPKPIHTQTG